MQTDTHHNMAVFFGIDEVFVLIIKIKFILFQLAELYEKKTKR